MRITDFVKKLQKYNTDLEVPDAMATELIKTIHRPEHSVNYDLGEDVTELIEDVEVGDDYLSYPDDDGDSV